MLIIVLRSAKIESSKRGMGKGAVSELLRNGQPAATIWAGSGSLYEEKIGASSKARAYLGVVRGGEDETAHPRTHTLVHHVMCRVDVVSADGGPRCIGVNRRS